MAIPPAGAWLIIRTRRRRHRGSGASRHYAGASRGCVRAAAAVGGSRVAAAVLRNAVVAAAVGGVPRTDCRVVCRASAARRCTHRCQVVIGVLPHVLAKAGPRAAA